MSALDPSVIASGVIYCYDPVTGVAESKGGVSWGIGSNSTGTGTPALPYATPKQALDEVRDEQASFPVTQNWEIRCVTDPLEASKYGVNNMGNTSVSPVFRAPFFFVLTGWLKTWGDLPFGGGAGEQWESIDHKPEIINFQGTPTSGDNETSFLRAIVKDMVFNNAGGLADFDAKNGKTDAWTDHFFRFISCVHKNTGSFAGNYRAGTHLSQQPIDVAWINCVFFDCELDVNVIAPGTTQEIHPNLINCYFFNTTKDCLKNTDDGTTVKTFDNVYNNIFNMDGLDLLFFTNTSTVNNELVVERNCNRYFQRNGAKFAEWETGVIDAVFSSPAAEFDEFSSSGTPLLVSDTDPALQDESFVLDKACRPDENVLPFLIDPTISGYDLFDALGFAWGDSIGPDNLAISNNKAIFSFRGCGPIQNELGMVPPLGPLVWPKGIIANPTVYAVAEVPVDPDSQGTCQFRVIQADDQDLTTGVVIADSFPLNVISSNNKIDFKEDGGGELTASIVIALYTTATLLTAIKTALEAAGAGTYTVTYSTVTSKLTIAVAGAVTNVQLLLATGTNIAEAFYKWTGYSVTDTGSAPSHEADGRTTENFYDASLDYEFSDDHTSGEDPTLDGIWDDLGIEDPGNSGIEGVNGVECVAGKHVRTDIGNLSAMDNKFHAIRFYSGTNKSAPEAGVSV